MYKVIFPEANNEYIKEAAARLGDICEPVLLESDLQSAAVKVLDGDVDAMIAGIDYSSRDVILATRDIIGIADGKQTFSSLFVAKFPDGRRIIISDGATCKNPNSAQLADIIELANDAAVKILDEEPRVAILSFSTFGSGGKDPSMDKTAEALNIIHERRLDIIVDGEMQLVRGVFGMDAYHHGDGGNVAQGKDDTGDDTGGKQRADGSARYDTVDDKACAGRDQDSQCAAGSDGSAGKTVVISVLPHLRQRNHAHGGGGGGGGTADGGEQRAGADRGGGKTALHSAEQLVHHVVQIRGHARIVAQVTHQNE